MNEFYLSCNLHRFLVPSAFFDVQQIEAATR